MRKKLALLNFFSVLLVIGLNYVSQIIEFNGVSIGEMSRRYDNLFTPSGYAFSIWGIIFLLLLGYGIYQLRCAFGNKDDHQIITQTGPWFIVANLLNCTWVIVFAYDYTGLSVLVMLGILFSLVKIILNTKMELGKANRTNSLFLWLPIGIYSGWISVAFIANIAAYLSKLGWEGGFMNELTWCLLMIGIAVVLNIIMVLKRNMIDFALVGIWALFAIYIRHKSSIETIGYSAFAGCILLSLTILFRIYRNAKFNQITEPK